MKIYQNKITKNKSKRNIVNKNNKSSVLADNLNFEIKRKLDFINDNNKREIIIKNNEESNLITKKLNRNTKKKSIDNTLNKNIFPNLSSSINNSKQHKINTKRSSKLISNEKNKKNINITKNSLNIKKGKRHLSMDLNYIKQDQYKKLRKNSRIINNNYLPNSNINFPNENSFSNSNYNIYEYETPSKYNNKNILTTFVQIEDLTKIPDRIGDRQNKYAEYDYNEAKRAAVTCRRIEYSYNLRNVIKSEISLDEVIMIQRWWRKILQRKNEEILNEIRINEQLNIDNIQRYILFLNKINYIYIIHLLKEFINKMKIGYGKLYYKNYFNGFATKIQRAFRKYISRKKNKGKKKLFKLLNKAIYKRRKIEFLNKLQDAMKTINKIKFLQNFVRYHLLRNNENYRLKRAHETHPFLYFLLKYKIPFNKKSIRKYKRKRKRFLNFVKRWKTLHKYKKTLKIMMLFENLKLIFKKKYFIYFIIRLVERINAMITYFLLQPLMKSIMRNYYLKKIKRKFLIWKKNDKKLKAKNILAWNLIAKIIKIYTINSLVKKIGMNKK